MISYQRKEKEMNTSFSFLKTNWPMLYKTAMLAESNLYNDPNTTLYKLGQFCEQMILEIYHIEEIKDIPSQQNERIKKLQREGLLDSSIVSLLHAVRRMRNDNVHGFIENVDDGIAGLKLTYRIAVWLEEVYGDPEFETGLYKVPEKEITVDMQSLELEIERLKKALAKKENIPVPKKETEEKMTFASQRLVRDLSEEETRILIDEQLRQVGWKADSKRLRFSKGARPEVGLNQAIAEWPTNSRYSKRGYVDYALFAGIQLLGFVEAKRKNLNVSSVLDTQCKDYASHVRKEDEEYVVGSWSDYQVPFIFSTNGRNYNEKIKTQSGIWFQDLRKNSNLPRPLRGWPDAAGLKAVLMTDQEKADIRLIEEKQLFLTSESGLNLRPYQIRAIKAAENAIIAGQKRLLLSMATGTGKTRTVLGLTYALLKAQRFRRILFLVDRRVLGDQAMDTFQEVRIEDLQPLNEIYNINALKDLNVKEKFPECRLQIATVQSMVSKLFSEGADQKPAVTDYDLIIVDEAHRGYLLDREMSDDEIVFRDEDDYLSKYKYVIDYFDAVKIGLTATPALHTIEIFGRPVFTYSYREAVLDGYLVDHDAPYELKTKLNTEGIKYKMGESLHIYDNDTNLIEELPDIPEDIEFHVEDFNRKIRTPGFNKAVIEEIAGYLDPTGREKTLIFAANDEHADEIVQILREFYNPFGLDMDAIMKITSKSGGGNRMKVDTLIRQFKSERFPNIAVTVDLLTTGVDVPEICNLVFMRPIRSRILYEQMLGRATRLCPEIEKDHFDIFDPIGVYKALQNFSDMKPVSVNPKKSFHDLIGELVLFPERKEKTIEQITSRLERKIKKMSNESKEVFEIQTGRSPQAFVNFLREIHDKDYAAQEIVKFKDTLEWVDTLKNAQWTRKVLYDDRADKVIEVERNYGMIQSSEDYLEEFERFIKENQDRVNVLNLICSKPKDLTFNDLKELKAILDANQFTEMNLQTAYNSVNQTDLTVDLIGLIRHYAIHSTLITHEQRVKDAMKRLKKNHSFTPAQRKWLDQIQKVILKDPILCKETFEMGSFRNKGGLRILNQQFDDQFDQIVDELNTYMYADGGYYA